MESKRMTIRYVKDAPTAPILLSKFIVLQNMIRYYYRKTIYKKGATKSSKGTKIWRRKYMLEQVMKEL